MLRRFQNEEISINSSLFQFSVFKKQTLFRKQPLPSQSNFLMGCGCLKKTREEALKVSIKPPLSDISSQRNDASNNFRQVNSIMVGSDQEGTLRSKINPENEQQQYTLNQKSRTQNSKFTFGQADNKPADDHKYSHLAELSGSPPRIQDLMKERYQQEDPKIQDLTKRGEHSQHRKSTKMNSMKDLVDSEEVEMHEQHRSSVPVLHTNPSRFSIEAPPSQKSLCGKGLPPLVFPKSNFRMKPIPYFQYSAKVSTS